MRLGVPDQILQRLENSHLAWKCYCKDPTQSLIFEPLEPSYWPLHILMKSSPCEWEHCSILYHRIWHDSRSLLWWNYKTWMFLGDTSALEMVGINVQKCGKVGLSLCQEAQRVTVTYYFWFSSRTNTLLPPLPHISRFFGQLFLPSFLTLHFSLEYKLSFHDDNYHLNSIPSVHLNFRPVYLTTN